MQIGSVTQLTETGAVAVPVTTTTNDLLHIVAARGASPEEVGKWMELERQRDAEQARRAFFAAVVECQRRMPQVPRLDSANGRPYATLQRIWKTAQPIMADCGLGVVWTAFTVGAEGMCHLEGMLTHAAGHHERLIRDMPIPDEIRGQNKCQRAGSADTYAKRYAVCDALGIITGTDDDGSGGNVQVITGEQAANLRDLCEAAGVTISRVLKFGEVDNIAQLPVAKYEEAARMLAAAANKGKK